MSAEHAEHPKGTWWIWKVFWILLIITTVEVALGIVKPSFLMGEVLGTRILNHLFIIMTLVKAAYIVGYFMHLKHERKNLIWSITLPSFVLIIYLVFILLTEANYLHDLL